MPYNPNAIFQPGLIQAGNVLGGAGAMAIMDYKQQKKEAKAAQAIFDALEQEPDPLTGEQKGHPMGMNKDQFKLLSGADQIAKVKGFVQAQSIKSAMDEAQRQRRADAAAMQEGQDRAARAAGERALTGVVLEGIRGTREAMPGMSIPAPLGLGPGPISVPGRAAVTQGQATRAAIEAAGPALGNVDPRLLMQAMQGAGDGNSIEQFNAETSRMNAEVGREQVKLRAKELDNVQRYTGVKLPPGSSYRATGDVIEFYDKDNNLLDARPRSMSLFNMLSGGGAGAPGAAAGAAPAADPWADFNAWRTNR